MLSPNDLMQLERKKISESKFNKQLACFKDGFPFSDIQRPATIDDGIISLSQSEQMVFINTYAENIKQGLKVMKFVPASGAATRMFKQLYEFIQSTHLEQKRKVDKEPYATFIKRLNDFAFIDDLKKILVAEDYTNLDTIIQRLLLAEGLNYGELPKGLLKFHRYDNNTSTPVEEHIREAIKYACCFDGKSYIHFTVSPEHYERFNELIAQKMEQYEKQYGVKLDIDFSFQKGTTDTIAVDLDNKPFYLENGSMLFRPAGHGALIENLNDLQSELVFIKNIDNVVPEHLLEDTIQFKKVLAGVLLTYKTQIYNILTELDHTQEAIRLSAIEKGYAFISDQLKITISTNIKDKPLTEQTDYIFTLLNKPIRVCGMVKNEGEPGGGPFWVKQQNGDVTLQIVESAQVDPNDAQKQTILSQSTHFNPVDLVCYLVDYKGDKFDLLQYVDEETGFISEKSMNGRELKALELPGLWNGAMANWLTFFVEVPVSTFNPVKTVMDLLRPQHQPK